MTREYSLAALLPPPPLMGVLGLQEGSGNHWQPVCIWFWQLHGCKAHKVEHDLLDLTSIDMLLLLQLQDGDRVRIDTKTHKVEALDISEEEWSKRKSAWKAPPLKATKGALYKYIKNVSSASLGCVTDL